ncbi:MAG: hypothetical protein WCB92_17405, partial [Mycobacterium sp.]
MPRTHQFLVTLMVHTNQINPRHPTDRRVGSLNEEEPPGGGHPKRRSTIIGISRLTPVVTPVGVGCAVMGTRTANGTGNIRKRPNGTWEV